MYKLLVIVSLTGFLFLFLQLEFNVANFFVSVADAAAGGLFIVMSFMWDRFFSEADLRSEYRYFFDFWVRKLKSGEDEKFVEKLESRYARKFWAYEKMLLRFSFLFVGIGLLARLF